MTAIKSKPVYEPLRADPRGRYHLLLGLGAPGAAALRRVLSELRAKDPGALTRTRILFVAEAVAADGTSATPADPGAPDAPAVAVFADTAALLAAYRSLLERALMGTRLYIGGPESFIGLAVQIALEFNLNQDEIGAEAVGTLARRVHCVHCRTQTERVSTNIVRCTGCERWLLVRDHYSRRLAAYMGVMVDAEVPGELPPVRVLYA